MRIASAADHPVRIRAGCRSVLAAGSAWMLITPDARFRSRQAQDRPRDPTASGNRPGMPLGSGATAAPPTLAEACTSPPKPGGGWTPVRASEPASCTGGGIPPPYPLRGRRGRTMCPTERRFRAGAGMYTLSHTVCGRGCEPKRAGEGHTASRPRSISARTPLPLPFRRRGSYHSGPARTARTAPAAGCTSAVRRKSTPRPR